MSSAASRAGPAVVVGATGALGSAIVTRLRVAGLEVVAVARKEPSIDDPGVIGCAADIGSDDAVAAIAAAVERAGSGPVRMVVQAAGLPAAGPVETIDPDALGRAVALKAGGLLRLVRAVDDRLSAGSRIVALGGHYGSEPAPYACAAGVTNAGLANLVRQLAVAYGPRGITAHLVAPGPADTPRLRTLSEQAAARRGVPVEQVLAERAAESPLGRLVTPAEVAWSVGLLLDPEAGALHGSTLALDVGARRGIF
ncbi:SDR family NAD(P)-dependent oxidoreductase [Pseudonocardia sp. H11422]|uniref:SDR family NAD(P)-dependent oxidoreductase n=1 Tax=Pseudonocardia sp. H11422 TaxID=2835866 RepID=UPI001BDC6180|nr:SDR family oxidoreductase [Pseudonocardia sp. H11422]